MSYQWLRTFADSWGLLAMLLMYLGFIGWAFRPRAKASNRRAATSIFDHDEERHDG